MINIHRSTTTVKQSAYYTAGQADVNIRALEHQEMHVKPLDGWWGCVVCPVPGTPAGDSLSSVSYRVDSPWIWFVPGNAADAISD